MKQERIQQTGAAIGAKRILILVPNGASTDNRVVREAESLKNAGYECLLVGLRLNHLPGKSALSANGVNIRRVDWQYRSFSKVALIYAVTLLPVLLVLLTTMIVAGWLAYFHLLLPLTGGLFDALSALLQPLVKLAKAGTQTTTAYTAQALRVQNPVFFHAMSLVLLFIGYRVLRRPYRRMASNNETLKNSLIFAPILKTIFQKIRFARNYGEKENIKNFTLLETVFSGSNSIIGRLHETIVTRVVAHQRERAFIEIGREFAPDIVQCHEVAPLPAAIALKRELGCKVIYEAHEIYDDLANASAALSKHHQKIHKNCLSEIDAFITVNPLIGEHYQETYPEIPTPVIMPNSVFPKTVKYDSRLHEAAKLPEGVKIVLYQGGFSPHRGMAVLLEAAFSLPDDWFVVFMGKGPLEEELKDAAKEYENAAFKKLQERLSLRCKSGFENNAVLKLAAPRMEIGDSGKVVGHDSVLIEEYMNMQAFNSDEGGGNALENLARSIRTLRSVEQELAAERQISQELAEVRASGALRKARFIPMAPHNELVEWTSGGTVGVVPYENVGLNHWNCSPNKIWEFPNAGVPLLCSRLNYLSQMIDTWNIGWTFSSDPKPQDIVSAIRSITDEDLKEKRKACESFIKQDNYTFHEKRLLDTVEKLSR